VIWLTPQLPTTATGKILKREIQIPDAQRGLGRSRASAVPRLRRLAAERASGTYSGSGIPS